MFRVKVDLEIDFDEEAIVKEFKNTPGLEPLLMSSKGFMKIQWLETEGEEAEKSAKGMRDKVPKPIQPLTKTLEENLATDFEVFVFAGGVGIEIKIKTSEPLSDFISFFLRYSSQFIFAG